MRCHALLQGIFPTQGSNPGLPHCRQILCCLSYQGSPRILEWVAYPFLLQGIFLTQELNWGLLHCRQILYQLSYQGSPFNELLARYFGGCGSVEVCLMFFLMVRLGLWIWGRKTTDAQCRSHDIVSRTRAAYMTYH